MGVVCGSFASTWRRTRWPDTGAVIFLTFFAAPVSLSSSLISPLHSRLGSSPHRRTSSVFDKPVANIIPPRSPAEMLSGHINQSSPVQVHHLPNLRHPSEVVTTNASISDGKRNNTVDRRLDRNAVDRRLPSSNLDKLWHASSHTTTSCSEESHPGQTIAKRRRGSSRSNPVAPSGRGNVPGIEQCENRTAQPNEEGSTAFNGETASIRHGHDEFEDLRSKLVSLMSANMDLQQRNRELREENQRMLTSSLRVKKASSQYALALDQMVMLLHKLTQLEARTRASRLLSASARLGRTVVYADGTEGWEDGEALMRCKLEQSALKHKAESLHKALIRAKRRAKAAERKGAKQTSEAKQAGDGGKCIGSEGRTTGLELEDVMGEGQEVRERVAVLREQLKHVRSRRKAVVQKVEAMKRERLQLARELRRQVREKRSKFLRNATSPVILHRRYLLLSLLGQGGFSEVYDAYDLLELRHVACKVHKVADEWPLHRKESYVRHVTREHNIHRHLRHPRVVALFDKFELDGSSFCTVMESCTGGDLADVLKLRGPLSEAEAKSIVRQVLAALAYLSSLRRKVIHYDLKPHNILFNADGAVQVSDFGLAKLFGQSPNPESSLKLSSIGAGTYWYLPPECFPPHNRASPAVDVWSVGVICFEMLTGARPFGHARDASQFWKERSQVWAKGLRFPAEPYVTDAAKRFISRCLTWDDKARPDVLTLREDPWLIDTEDISRKTRKSSTAAAKR